MRMAVMASNTITFSDSSYRPLQYSDAVYLATRGGALLTGRLDHSKLEIKMLLTPALLCHKDTAQGTP